ncbi:MAG TPA: hypothetical protein IAC33_09665 [Candidatus Fimousia stercorigallinarum]|nr:hypothetical protein [Candidatus Fimousia stercorigallinarum]
MSDKEKYLHEIIDDIEEFINDAKPARFNPGKVMVDEEILMTMLEELRSRLPSEMERSKQIVQSKQDIIDDAKIKADAILQNAIKEASETVEDHEIVQLAKRRAADIEREADQYADAAIAKAKAEAKELRVGAMEYTVDLMEDMKALMGRIQKTQDEIHSQVTERISAEIADIQANTIEIEGQLFAIKNPASASRGRTMDQFRQPDK